MTEHRLIPDSEMPNDRTHTEITQLVESKFTDHRNKVRQSALWAAYGDALGWISELTDEKGLRRRTKGATLHRPIEWKRRIGGRSGVTATLPQGCYSDDSQLRLATGRSIRPEGFDVEMFSKVELPIWLSYELGGGNSTKAAATNLARPRVQWFANTFKGWTNSGGNGAAMRIQPHVWASSDLNNPMTYLPDVVRNAICTHSHPNGLMGAVIHALTLAHAMHIGEPPSPDDLLTTIDVAAKIPDLIQDDFEVGIHWKSTFERESEVFGDTWALALSECTETIHAVADTSNEVGAARYAAIVDRLKLRNPSRRGSGMLTAIAAAGLAWCDSKPDSALRIAANQLGTDTDTIATMAGAILGVNTDEEPQVEVLDADLFKSENNRLSEIAWGGVPLSHTYPDLLHWSAPKARADTLSQLDDGSLYVHGLGHAESLSEPISSPIDEFMWQWVRLEIGQTLIIKRRRNVIRYRGEVISPPINQPLDQIRQTASESTSHAKGNELKTADVPSDNTKSSETLTKDQLGQPDIEAMIDYLEKHNYEDENLGRAMRRVVNTCSSTQIAAFLSVVIERLRVSSNPTST
ncbi:MAG: ADP-ribosylglycohydrolase family protein [Dehalococcoidia bacterium]|nr:ADP-ribosylglycohydrolase family protein [Dehalococcoidia bacterium]